MCPQKALKNNNAGGKATVMLGILKTKKEVLMSIPLDEIAPNPSQPRKYFDEEGLEELKNSILKYGLIQPITVRRSDDGCYELISGERRFRAAVRAGLKTINAYVINSDSKKCAVLSLLENLQREDLSFFEIAQSYETLIAEQGMTQIEVAESVGTSRSNVISRLRLLQLPSVVKKLIREYNLTERHARALLRLDSEEKQLEAVKKMCLGNMSAQEAEDMVKKMVNPIQKIHNPPIKELNTANIAIFKNTVKKAVDMMKNGGIDAKMLEEEFEWGTQYRILINKEEND